MKNPFLEPLNTPFQTAPFDQIKLEHFMPALEYGINEQNEELEQIIGNPQPPTFTNTIEALSFSGSRLSFVASVFFNLNSAETNDEMDVLAQKISPVLTKHNNNILLNQKLFARVNEVWNARDQLHLDADQITLLEKTYLSFVRNGANLTEEEKEKVREIDARLAKLSLDFGQNALKETNEYELHITNETGLEGLPDDHKEAARETAKEKNKDGWVFTLHYPSFLPFMTYVKNRDLRKKMYLASGRRAYQDNERNNEGIIKELTQLRLKRAQLLGYNSHADFVLERRMAENPEKVNSFLNYLLEKAKPAGEKDVAQVAEFARKTDGLTDLQRWDFNYYSEKLKKEKFEVDDETTKPYFQLENVISGVFKTAQKLFGITFHERDDIPKYHRDVITYEVKDENDNHLAVFYADFFPRAGKRAGAWMTVYKEQKKENDLDERPHVSNVCNFTKPTASKPSLLTFNEVTTLFHEFGHALHGMLSKGRYPGITGASVLWDFVELPSQLMENWCYEKECLDLFAVHYKTGEKIPAELVAKIKAAGKFNEGYQTVRQVSLGMLDMKWHHVADADALKNTTVAEVEKSAFSPTDLLSAVEGTSMSCQFHHLFQGGYSAGYYSYKWAEVLDADAFEAFAENGIFDTETAQKFKKHILEAGGSEHPAELYRKFRGRDADPDALLRRAGLL